VAQAAEHLCSKFKALSSNPSTVKSKTAPKTKVGVREENSNRVRDALGCHGPKTDSCYSVCVYESQHGGGGEGVGSSVPGKSHHRHGGYKSGLKVPGSYLFPTLSLSNVHTEVSG
jgi:hypothetical protein